MYATFVRSLGEAAAPGGGECGPCPNFAYYTLAFDLQLRKNHGKTSVRVTERCVIKTNPYKTLYAERAPCKIQNVKPGGT
jgi:hypothetical protein